ncbi:MAG TPA: hypothetical protein VJ064_04365, partial [Limnochordia bacterium]|nr:hypothetical protein [Limnochordia bacterium]
MTWVVLGSLVLSVAAHGFLQWRAGAPDPSFFYDRAQFEEFIRGYEEYQRQKEQLLQEEAESGVDPKRWLELYRSENTEARHYEEVVGWDSEQMIVYRVNEY